MYWNGLRIIPFDIETTSLSAPEGEFICSAIYENNWENGINYKVDYNLKELKETLSNFDKENILLITWNGENYKTGFDAPWLRTKCALNNIGWILKDYYHLDIYPLVEKYFNNKITEIKTPSKSKLYKSDLEKLAVANGLGYSNKNKTYQAIKKLDNPEWLDYKEEKQKDKFDLQSIYQTFFDPNAEEEYVDGGQMIELYKKGNIEEIREHNMRDVKRLYDIAELLIDYIPKWEIERNIKVL